MDEEEWTTISAKLDISTATFFKRLCELRGISPSKAVSDLIHKEVALYDFGRIDAFNLFEVVVLLGTPLTLNADDDDVQLRLAEAFSGWPTQKDL